MNIQFENFFTLENFISHNEKINLLMQTKDSSILNTTRKELEDLFNKPVLNFLKSLRDQKILKPDITYQLLLNGQEIPAP